MEEMKMWKREKVNNKGMTLVEVLVAMAGIFTNLYAFVFIFYTSLQFYQSVFFL